MINISINNKTYSVKEAITPSEKLKGLQNVDSLDNNSGMIFYYNPPQDVSFWMKDVKIPLDVIFINEDQDVVKVSKGQPNDEDYMTARNIAYVLELNQDSGVKKGDSIEFEDEKLPQMKVLFQDGSTQYELWGGERIFSRKNTRILIKKAKKAAETESENDYKSLGKYMFKCIKQQDEREPEYVNSPK